MENLGTILKDCEKYAEAEKTFELACHNNSINYGPDHPLTLRSMMSLAGTLLAKRELARGKELLEKAAARFNLTFWTRASDGDCRQRELTVALIADRQFDEAEKILARNVELASRTFGPEVPRTLAVMANLASVSLARGDWRAAVQKISGDRGGAGSCAWRRAPRYN
jgi:hypothetical protein